MGVLDDSDRGLLALLQKNDRLSLAELGQELKLAPSTVNDHIKRMIKNGFISGFHAAVVPQKVGLGVLAFILVCVDEPETESAFVERMTASGEVLECHTVTGPWNYLLKVRLKDAGALEEFRTRKLKSSTGIIRSEILMALSSVKESAMLDLLG